MVTFSFQPHENDESGRPWYDTVKGITFALTSLNGLNRLVNERHDAGYNRGERLNQFYIMNGRYSLDTCGNCGSVSGIPKDIPQAGVPLVLSFKDFFKFLDERIAEEEHPSICTSMNGGNLPKSDLFCSQCGQGWSIINCHDVVIHDTTKVFLLTDFVGMTLGEVKLLYGIKSDAIYRMQPEFLIRHDRFIDKSPKYPDTEDDWRKGIVVNEKGWVGEKDDINDDYVIQEGDEGFFNIRKYFHGECNRNYLATEEEKKFREIFEKAGFQITKLTPIPNQYCSCEMCAPWFDVETEFGVIQIGWRKRVINIDWDTLNLTETVLHLFQDEDVTKGEGGIHAWGWDKAKDYLSRLHGHLAENVIV